MANYRSIINVSADGVINSTAFVAKITYDGILVPVRVIVNSAKLVTDADGTQILQCYIPTNYNDLLTIVSSRLTSRHAETTIDGCLWEMGEHYNFHTTITKSATI